MAETQAPPQQITSVSGNVAFYRRPEPLALAPHGKLGVERNDKPFAFAKATHLVPLTVGDVVAGLSAGAVLDASTGVAASSSVANVDAVRVMSAHLTSPQLQNFRISEFQNFPTNSVARRLVVVVKL